MESNSKRALIAHMNRLGNTALNFSFVMFAIAVITASVAIYSYPYYKTKKERDIKACEDAGLVYYKPHRSDPICINNL